MKDLITRKNSGERAAARMKTRLKPWRSKNCFQKAESICWNSALAPGAIRCAMRVLSASRFWIIPPRNWRRRIEKLGEGPGYRYIAADIYRLPFAPATFDAATMIRTLHHFAQPQLALEQVRGCLTGGACFILEFANKRNLKSVLRYAAGKQKWNPFSREAVEFIKLNFDLHPAAVKALLRESGFEIEKQISVSYLRAGFFKRLFPQKVLTGLESLLQAAASWTAYSPSIFLRTKTKGEATLPITKDFFRCPACGHSPLEDTPPELTCDACGRTYPVKDGIYDFRVDRE